MPIGAILGGAAFGLIGAVGSNMAAGQQADAANNATAAKQQMFAQTQANLQPYMGQGTMALSSLNKYLGLGANGLSPDSPLLKQFTPDMMPNDPGYQYRLQQGQQGILQNRSAMGGLDSGATLKSLNSFSQGMASDEFNNAYQRYMQGMMLPINVLGGQVASGQNAAAGLGGIGQNYANMYGENITGAGNAAAAGTMGMTNALTGAGTSAMNNYLMQKALAGGGGMAGGGGFTMPSTDTSAYGSGAYNFGNMSLPTG